LPEVLAWYKYERAEYVSNPLKGIGLRTLLLIAILLAFPLAVASMISDLGGSGSPGPGLSGNSSASSAPTSTIAANLSQLGNTNAALVLVVAVILLELPILYRSRTNILWELLTVAGSVVAAVTAIVLVSGITSIQNMGLELNFGGGLYFVVAVTLGLAGAGVLAAILLLRRSQSMEILSVPPPRPRKLLAGPSAGGFSPYYGATDGSHRGVVISCYSAFCAILMKLGVGNPPSRTPREFASEASERTPLDRELGRRITALFEKARYSVEEVPEGDARESRAILHEIDGELGSGMEKGAGRVTEG
jgi:hypothetical protein